MTHWKQRATECAVDGCERTRRKGWTTCTLLDHHERGVSLYGLKRGKPRLRAIRPGGTLVGASPERLLQALYASGLPRDAASHVLLGTLALGGYDLDSFYARDILSTHKLMRYEHLTGHPF